MASMVCRLKISPKVSTWRFFCWQCPGLESTTTSLLIYLHSFKMSVELTQFTLRSFKSEHCCSEHCLTFPFLYSFLSGWYPLKCHWPDSTMSNVCSRERGYTSSWRSWAEGRRLKCINPILSNRHCVKCFQI